MAEVHDFFTWVDWLVLGGYLALTTWVGHLVRGKQASIQDFFLGGRSLPWPAVSGSIIATEISGVTFIGVPGMLFALHGNFTYLQWAIGSILARILVGLFFVRAFYEQDIYSPYDYMGRRLGNATKVLATILFKLGSILGQSVRVLVASIPLKVVTGLPIEACIVIIGIFAVGWTLMGGMRTVIWTDVMQFLLFTCGGLLALFTLVHGIEGGFGGFWEKAELFGRTQLVDTTLQADLQFTLWVAIFAVPFQNLTAFGVDQLNAQRMFCCRNAMAARKAIIWSSAGQILTLLMLMVGAALVVHFNQDGFQDNEAAIVYGPETGSFEERLATARATEAKEPLLGPKSAYDDEDGTVVDPSRLSSVHAVPGKNLDFVFPIWIVMALPVGLSGLVLAGVFAAAISSLDSILAALSQTTLSLIHHPERQESRELDPQRLVWQSRLLVILWGLVLTGFTLILKVASEGIPIVDLAFGMTAYTFGPLLGLMFCALLGKGSTRGLILGSVLSVVLVLFMRTDVWALLKQDGKFFSFLGALPTYELSDDGQKLSSTVAYVWAWPVTTFLTLLCGLLWPSAKSRSA